MLIPRQAVPPLQVATLAHGLFTLPGDAPPNFTLVVFYRGLHCPIYLKYLLELGRLLPEFDQRGVKVIALSSDTQDCAQAMTDKLTAPHLRMGCGLSLAAAPESGLYISTSRGSTSIGIEEPAPFSKPGLFFVRPDGTLLLRRRADHSVRAAALRRAVGRARLRAGQELPGARRIRWRCVTPVCRLSVQWRSQPLDRHPCRAPSSCHGGVAQW